MKMLITVRFQREMAGWCFALNSIVATEREQEDRSSTVWARRTERYDKHGWNKPAG